jgi:hypothetical protein
MNVFLLDCSTIYTIPYDLIAEETEICFPSFIYVSIFINLIIKYSLKLQWPKYILK